MLIQPTTNKNIIKIYNYLCNILIPLIIFLLFFGIFIKSFFSKYETFLFTEYITNSLKPYKILNINNFFNELIKESASNPIQNNIFILFKKNYNEQINNLIQNTRKKVIAKDNEIKPINDYYDNLLISVVSVLSGVFALVLIIPVLLGFISYKEINLIYLLVYFLINFAFIVPLMILLLLFIIPSFNPFKLYNFWNAFLA